MMEEKDRALLLQYRSRRMQRAVEYILLGSLFFFFLLAFFGNYRISIAIALFVMFFGMNFRLTTLRETRKVGERNRQAIVADALESILFLLLLLLFSFPVLTDEILGIATEEHYALIASVLCGIFFGGLVGEIHFRLRRLQHFDPEDQVRYMQNLRRTIVLPYLNRR